MGQGFSYHLETTNNNDDNNNKIKNTAATGSQNLMQL